jgi:acetyl-CoA carboxylase carboxyl transferase subunit alpha
MKLKEKDYSDKNIPLIDSSTKSTKTAFERVLIARHGDRPYTLDFIAKLFEDFTEIHGDRRFGDDPAIICGFAKFHEVQVVVIGHQKGRDTKQRQYRNFGMPKPEGYRKALRAMKLAEKFGSPILSFVDTPGAYPGIDAEERGQAEAIAHNLREMTKLRIPIIVTVIGEGGSGGALAIGIGDQVLMLENAVYSVITPEGCAAILWKDVSQADQAAASLRLTAEDLFKEGIIDAIVAEPPEGGHTNHELTVELLDVVLKERLFKLMDSPLQQRLSERYRKLQKFGKWGSLGPKQHQAVEA